MPQRLGSKSRLVQHVETTYGVDPAAAGFFLPISDRDGIGSDQTRVPVSVYTGTREPRGSVLGLINAQGDIPVNLEFLTLGRTWKPFLGSDKYVRDGMGNGGSNHKFGIGTPGSVQLEKQFLETPALYVRNKGVRYNSARLGFTPEGVAVITYNAIGNGDEAQTTLQASPTEDPFEASSYFNGELLKAGTVLASVTTFEMTVSNEMTRQDIAFNKGIAGAVNAGMFSCVGRLGLLFEDLAFYNEAVNSTEVSLECYWSNKLPDAATKWLRMIIPVNLFSRTSPRAGGAPGITIEQDFVAQLGTDGAAGTGARKPEVWSNLETYNITATTNSLAIKVDGGANQVKTLTIGAARTAAQVITDIGAITGGAADAWHKRVRLVSNTKGTGGSIAIDTAVANSAHAALGYDAVVRSGGAASAFFAELFNDKNTDY